MRARCFAYLLGWAGRRRIAAGYCPACYSSPPMAACPICDGTHDYGDALTPDLRRRWGLRWAQFWQLVS